MKRKIILILILFSSFFCSMNLVYAQSNEIYYVNPNNVEFNKIQYDFFSKMFWDGYQQYVSLEEFDMVSTLGLFNAPVESQVVTIYASNDSMFRTSTITEKLRTLTISKSCTSECFVSLVVKWNGIPTIKSYDVFGARVVNSSLLKINNALVSGYNYSKIYSTFQRNGDGFGYSIEIPNTNNITVSVSFTTLLNGIAYGSYQHAMSNLSFSNSQLYTIGAGGYGGVFKFYGAAIGKYDNANGVNILLN